MKGHKAKCDDTYHVGEAVEALDYLGALLRSGADIERLQDGYFEATRVLCAVVAAMIQRTVQTELSLMELARERVAVVVDQRYGSALPADVLTVRKYGRTHALLLGYLWQRVGRPVSASRLRLLVGDQVHTERRVRELRDLGFAIEARHLARENQYTLLSLEQDLDGAALAQVRANIRSTKTISAQQKRYLRAVLDGGER